MTRQVRTPVVSVRSAVGWVAALVAVTAALIPFRDRLNDAHVAIAFLLVVLGAGAQSGRRIGLGVAVLSFLSFDWFFVPPYGTLAVDKPLDWIVLLSFLAMSVVVTQLFERARHEAAAALRARQREAIVASVSHDLRTPLTTIKALAHDLAADGDDRAELIEAEVDRLNVLVGDLLDFSRINAGNLPISIEPNEAEDLLGAALQQVAGVSRDRVVSVSLDPAHPLLFGRFDFTHTLRVVVNLIENALKYAPGEQPIEVSVKRDGPWLAFAVSDRGPGVCGRRTRQDLRAVLPAGGGRRRREGRRSRPFHRARARGAARRLAHLWRTGRRRQRVHAARPGHRGGGYRSRLIFTRS